MRSAYSRSCLKLFVYPPRGVNLSKAKLSGVDLPGAENARLSFDLLQRKSVQRYHLETVRRRWSCPSMVLSYWLVTSGLSFTLPSTPIGLTGLELCCLIGGDRFPRYVK